ncbi:hypothetical protein [Kribbella sp. CA-293567]|uniref:hypothetical protein n=1 Tax=Kribbella sp. CA-293567 TaxID=3002436 RepID=UPI0022DCFD1D|nr:hypothetical protein [Kribbella sp. CA-293567]WBQ05349.1 hypothetical protein OX958_00785 [Kribbella sp. CA-293567]
MELRAHAISVQGPHAPMLLATSVSVSDHQLVLLAGYPGPGHVALALGLSGRLKPNGGDVQLDGSTNGRVLRQRVAVVDAPGITEPDDALPVQTVVGEELAIAGLKAGRKAVAEWLSSHDWAEYADRRWEHLPVAVRTRMLAELTVARPDVKVVILTMPDRLGGDPHDWYGVGRELASRGYGVIVTCAEASARLLGVEAAQFGSVNQPDPVQVEAAQVEAVQSEPVQSEEPAGVEEPAESAEAEEPAEPAEPADTEEPAESAESAESAEAEEPAKPTAKDSEVPEKAATEPAPASEADEKKGDA